MRRDKSNKQTANTSSSVEDTVVEISGEIQPEEISVEFDTGEVNTENFIEDQPSINIENSNIEIYFENSQGKLSVTDVQTAQSMYAVKLTSADVSKETLLSILTQQNWSLFEKSEESKKSLRNILTKYTPSVVLISISKI